SDYQIISPLITFFAQPDTVWFGGGDWDSRRKMPCHRYSRQAAENVPSEVFPAQWANGCALFASAEVFRRVGPLDTDYYALWDEVDWCFRASKLGFSCAVQPKARVAHKVSSTFGTDQSDQYVYLLTRNRLLFIRRHYGRADARRSAVGQAIVALRALARSAVNRDTARMRSCVAQTQANLDAMIGR